MERLTGYTSAWMPRLIAKDWRRKLIITGRGKERHYRLEGIIIASRHVDGAQAQSALM